MANNEYTEKQLKVINGEIPFESTQGRFLVPFYKKALRNNDDELAKKIRRRLDALKAEAYKRNNERGKKRSKEFYRNELPEWRQPRSNEYTAHQIKIVRGEIPYEKVHSNELISIYQKAHNNGDYELSERIFDLIYARRMQRMENHKARVKIQDKTHRLSEEFDSFVKLDINLPLTDLDKAALIGDIDLNSAGKVRAAKALEILCEQGLENEYAIIQGLLKNKNDPNSMLIVKDHWEAINLIEELLQLPIRRPDTWFIDKDMSKEGG